MDGLQSALRHVDQGHLLEMLDSIPERIGFIDLELNYRYVNRAFASFIGMPREDVIGRNIADLRGAAAAALVREHVERMLRGEAVRWEGWHDYGPGKRRFIERFYSTHRDETGALDGIYVFVRDLTELKSAEDSLRDSEQRCRAIAAAHPVPLVISRVADGQILFANEPFQRLMGTESDAALAGKNSRDLFADPERGALFARGFPEGNFPAGLEVQMKKADGSTYWASLTARGIAFDGEDAVVTSVLDLSERRRAEQEIAHQREALHQSEKLSALGSLLSNVAHELNNPLSVVLGHSQMLAETATEPKVADRAGKIQASAKRCASIVRTFLSLARREDAPQVSIDLNEIVANALTLMDYGLRTAGIEVVRDLEPELPTTLADADQMPLVVTNLLLNAQQALQDFPEPRKLWVTTGLDETAEFLRLVVADNGPGVPRDMRERIFEQFVSSKPVGRGTGVGLAVSQSVLSAHGGRITVEDTPGGGATFIAVLPVRRSAGEASPHEAAAREAIGNGAHRLLIVEDETDVSDMLAEMLAPDGFDVYVAESGREAVKLLDGRDFEVIISDLRMPDMDGPALFRWIQSERPHLVASVIFITGDMLSASSRQFLDQTTRPYLEKPLNPNDVRRAVVRVLGADAAE